MARKDEKLTRQARLACEKFREYFKQNIDTYHEMHDFVLGQQWSEDEEDMLKTFKKVPLVSNKLGTLANTLIGEQQQNTPQLQVVPMTNCDEETAHLRELIVKDIMFSNSATVVYQVAASQAFIGGFGAFLWDTDYIHQRSFDLEIVPRHFKDASRCYWDIGAESINKTDGLHCGYLMRVTKEKFRQMYGKDIEDKVVRYSSPTATKEEIALAVQPNEGDDPFTWADNEGITIMHHYKRKFVKDTLYKLSNGKSYNQEELEDIIEMSKDINARHEEEQEQNMMQQMMQPPQSEQPSQGMQENQMQPPAQQDMQLESPNDMQPQNPQNPQNPVDVPRGTSYDEESDDEDRMTLWDDGEPVRIEDKRDFKRHKIIHYKIAGEYILEEGEFPSEQLPLVFVDQRSHYDKNGKQVCSSFFGDCKDTQRYINYLRTQSAFIIKVSRYDQFIGSKKNVQSTDTARNWRDPSAMQGLLTYDESPMGHKPEQIAPPELSQSLYQQYQLAIEDLYTSTGLYPTKLGQQGNEVSGSAIDARTRQGSYPTYVAFNSVNRAIATGGEIVNEMIPKVYDAERVISLMTPDEGLKSITVNHQADEYGELIENDIRKGTYEVRLKPGPSYEGQKQEALQALQQVMQIDPQTFSLVADLYADNLPLANNLEIKNRLKTLVPPEIIQAGKTGQMPHEKGQNQPSPEQQQMQMQMQMQQQQMQMEAQFKQQEIALKKQELMIKERQAQADIEIEQMKLQIAQMELAGNVEDSKMRYMAETGRTEADTAIAHADNMVKILTHKIPEQKI